MPTNGCGDGCSASATPTRRIATNNQEPRYRGAPLYPASLRPKLPPARVAPIIEPNANARCQKQMRICLLTLIILLGAIPVFGQDATGLGIQGHSWDVFLRAGASSPGQTEVIFLDLLTGESDSFTTTGERHTLLADAVLYFDHSDHQVKRIKPDGVIREHPFITMTSADYRLDWTVSKDRRQIAWAVSQRAADQMLTTSIMLADNSGSQIRQLLVYGPRPGIRLLPVAFGADGTTLYIDVHADGAELATPYTRRSNLFVLDFGGAGVVTQLLPGEAACFCAVGFGKDLMLRLAPSGEPDSTQVEIYNIRSGAARVIAPVARGDYNEAGNLLLSPDDALAIYALTRASGFRAAEQELRTVLVLADLVNARQRVLGDALPALARPIRWTEGNSAVLFTLEGHDGVWKLRLDDGATVKVADATYLGMLNESATE